MAKFQKEVYHVAGVLRQAVFVAGEATLVKEYKKEMDYKLQGRTSG